MHLQMNPVFDEATDILGTAHIHTDMYAQMLRGCLAK